MLDPTINWRKSMFRKPMQFALAAALCSFSLLADAQSGISGDVVRIGVLTDMGGALSDLSGAGSVTAVRMAVEDFGGKVLG
jgi:branched-chain amino acid transport system substrate-binding protein